MTLREETNMRAEESNTPEEPTREEERGDVAESDAPTAEEENEGMNTVLDANPLTGVQDNASDE